MNELLIIDMIYVPNFMKFHVFKLVSEADDKFYELKTQKKPKRRTKKWLKIKKKTRKSKLIKEYSR